MSFLLMEWLTVKSTPVKPCRFRSHLKPKQERSADLTTLNNEFRDHLQSVAGIRVTSVAAAQDSVSGGQKPIMISIKGSDLNELQKSRIVSWLKWKN